MKAANQTFRGCGCGKPKGTSTTTTTTTPPTPPTPPSK
jgi:hypothetical protein